MPKNFVGGILLDPEGCILLVKRSVTDTDMPGLWSLPGGAVNEGEGDKGALVREFREEVGLSIRIGERITSVNRVGWLVNIYVVYALDTSPDTSRDPMIVDARYYGLDQFPDAIVLEAAIPVNRYILSKLDVITPRDHHLAVESIFASLFYSYVNPALALFEDIPGWELVRHIITAVPRRKFRSAIPILLSDMSTEAKSNAATAEFLFALWTILDDLCDKRKARHGAQTVHERFGIARTASFLFSVLAQLRAPLTKVLPPSAVDQVIDSMAACGLGQFNRFKSTVATPSTHLTSSVMRSSFLGVSWAAGLDATNCEIESAFIRNFYHDSAEFGQLLNDYLCLVNHGGIEDLRARADNYGLLLLREAASEADACALDRLAVAGTDFYETARLELLEMLEKYGVLEIVRRELQARQDRLLDDVLRSTLHSDKKNVLVGWLQSSCITIIPQGPMRYVNMREGINNFIDSVDNLCYGLSQWPELDKKPSQLRCQDESLWYRPESIVEYCIGRNSRNPWPYHL